MNECSKCSDHLPCSCGWNLRSASLEYLEEQVSLLICAYMFKKCFPKAVFSSDYSNPFEIETEDDKAFSAFVKDTKEILKKSFFEKIDEELKRNFLS